MGARREEMGTHSSHEERVRQLALGMADTPDSSLPPNDTSQPCKQKEAELFDHLVQRYGTVADAYIQGRLSCSQTPNSCDAPSPNFLSLNFHTLSQAQEEKKLCEHVVTVFKRFGLLQRFSIEEQALHSYLQQLKSLYQPLPYHNFLHGIDVFQFCCYLLMEAELAPLLMDEDILCLLLIALGHDVGHPGVTHPFQGKLETAQGKVFEGESLEDCHAKVLLHLLLEGECEVGKNWDRSTRSLFSKRAAASIAATDMNNHLLALAQYDQLLQQKYRFHRQDPDSREFLSQLALKCADVSNLVRSVPIAYQWAEAIMQESHHTLQPPSPLEMHSTQVAFIDFIAKPLFGSLYLTLPKIGDCLWNLHLNRESWVQKKR